MLAALPLLVCLAFGLSGAAPLAEDPAWIEGLALFDQLEFEQAAFRFESAALDPARPPAERAQALLWLGLAYANAGRFELAEGAFVRAFVADEGVHVPPDQAPRVLELIESARTTAAAARAAQVAEPAPAAPAPAEAAPSPVLLTGVGVAGAGAVGLVASGVLGALTARSLAVAGDKEQFYEDAKTAQDQANAFVTGAVVSGAAGLVLAVGGGALIAWSFAE